MISIEIMLIMAFTLMAGVIYMIFRYFDDLICDITRNINHLENRVDHISHIYSEKDGIYIKGCKDRADFFEQKLKDGLQSNAICCRSAMDKLTNESNNTRKMIVDMNTLYSSRPPTGGGPSWYKTTTDLDNRITLLEKDKQGSIKVVVKEKDNGTRKLTTKKPVSSIYNKSCI